MTLTTGSQNLLSSVCPQMHGTYKVGEITPNLQTFQMQGQSEHVMLPAAFWQWLRYNMHPIGCEAQLPWICLFTPTFFGRRFTPVK